jgi:HEAT repeat protein
MKFARCVGLWMLLAACSAPPTEEPREMLRVALSAYEPESAPDLRALPGDIAGELLSLASDPREPRLLRKRALEALGDFSEPRVLSFLADWSRDHRDDPFLTPAALGSLSRVGAERPERLSEQLRAALSSSAPGVRQRAAWQLHQLDHPAARDAVARALGDYLDADTRAALLGRE